MKTIAGVTLGGERGLHAPAMAGSIFYDRDMSVSDHKQGIFNEEKVMAALKAQTEWSEKTGVPEMVDIVASTPEAIKRYIDFVTSHTQAPILIDGSSEEVRLAGLQYCKDKGIVDRAIYNSISSHSTEDELGAIKASGCTNAVLLAYNPTDFSAEGKRKVVFDTLLPMADKAGIKNPIIDTAVIDLPSLGVSSNLIMELKSEGFLVGNSPHNAISRWVGLKSKMGKEAVKPCSATANSVAAAWGADFILYGPIRHAELVFPPVAMVIAALGQLPMEKGKMPSMNHPMFKIA